MSDLGKCLVDFSQSPGATRSACTGRMDGWSFATDGCAVVCVATDVGFAESAPPHVTQFIRQVISAKAVGMSTSLPFFRTFVGPDAPPVTCEECDDKGIVKCVECEGEGRTECECPECGHEHEGACSDCEGEGQAVCDCEAARHPRQPGWVLGLPFDRQILRRIVSAMPGTSVTIAVRAAGRAARHSDGEKVLWLFGEGWRAVVMPLRWEKQPGEPELILPEAVAQ